MHNFLTKRQQYSCETIHLPSVLPESMCSDEVICSQNCVRVFGVEVCSCNPGYTLDIDNVTCLGEELVSI